MSEPTTTETMSQRRSLLMTLPLIAFAALIALFWYRLGTGDPSRIPSALIGHAAPQTALPPLEGLTNGGAAVPGLDPAIFKGNVSIVNVWASWCVACREEHPVLVEFAKKRAVPIYGLDYKDTRADAGAWLARFGNPYDVSLFDADGRVGIDFGVYGVPETYVVKGDGTIAYRFVGPLSEESLRQVLLPQIIAASR